MKMMDGIRGAIVATGLMLMALPLVAAETHDVTPIKDAADVVASPDATDVASLGETSDSGQPTLTAGLRARSSEAPRTRDEQDANLGGPTPNVAACGTSIVGALGTCVSSNCFTSTQTGRTFRNAVASACSPGKVCPGANAGGPFIYDVYTFDNTDPNAVCNCITVNLNVGTCGAGVHATAFAGTYPLTPAWVCAPPGAKYIGDVGSSVSQPFSFELPPGTTTWSLVFNQNFTTTPKGCTYSATISCGTTPSIQCALLPIESKLDAMPCDIFRLLNPPKPGKPPASDAPCP